MVSNAPAYAMLMWNMYNETGKVDFCTTDIGMDEPSWRELEALGVTSGQDIAGYVTFNPVAAKRFLKIG